jgi:hypothetical protein
MYSRNSPPIWRVTALMRSIDITKRGELASAQISSETGSGRSDARSASE